MLLDFLKPTDSAVTVHGSSAQFLPFCVIGDRDEELVVGMQHSLGVDGLNVLRVLWLRECLIHIRVIGSQLYFL